MGCQLQLIMDYFVAFFVVKDTILCYVVMIKYLPEIIIKFTTTPKIAFILQVLTENEGSLPWHGKLLAISQANHVVQDIQPLQFPRPWSVPIWIVLGDHRDKYIHPQHFILNYGQDSPPSWYLIRAASDYLTSCILYPSLLLSYLQCQVKNGAGTSHSSYKYRKPQTSKIKVV